MSLITLFVQIIYFVGFLILVYSVYNIYKELQRFNNIIQREIPTTTHSAGQISKTLKGLFVLLEEKLDKK